MWAERQWGYDPPGDPKQDESSDAMTRVLDALTAKVDLLSEAVTECRNEVAELRRQGPAHGDGGGTKPKADESHRMAFRRPQFRLKFWSGTWRRGLSRCVARCASNSQHASHLGRPTSAPQQRV